MRPVDGLSSRELSREKDEEQSFYCILVAWESTWWRQSQAQGVKMRFQGCVAGITGGSGSDGFWRSVLRQKEPPSSPKRGRCGMLRCPCQTAKSPRRWGGFG